VELWTKRNFRCDCGNSKFGEFFCKLFPNKDIENVENLYNHNFKGSYCTCGWPYPDPVVEEQVEMIQCCICEDWFHEEHLGLEPSDEVSCLCFHNGSKSFLFLLLFVLFTFHESSYGFTYNLSWQPRASPCFGVHHLSWVVFSVEKFGYSLKLSFWYRLHPIPLYCKNKS